MRYCLIKTPMGLEKEIPIIKNVFEEATGRQPPQYLAVNNKIQAYAKRPACLNPVQIIGFYTRLPDGQGKNATQKSYAKHCGRNIPTLANHNQATYESCPYRIKKTYNREDKRKSGDVRSETIKQMFLLNFDKIAHLIKKIMGINYSENLLGSMLEEYIKWDAWDCVGATVENIPCFFLYMTDSQQLFGQHIKKDSFLYSELKKKEYGTLFAGSDSKTVQIAGFKNRPRARLKHHFTGHKSEPQNGEIVESCEVVFKIYDYHKNTEQEILRKKIIFDHDYFFNLLHLDSWKTDHRLLNMAKSAFLKLGRKI
ncbi:MAG: hypothetical protein FWG65_13255 [Turicibacter sp.]|nr:hypothetical protein [Turicibacter sp.]